MKIAICLQAHLSGSAPPPWPVSEAAIAWPSRWRKPSPPLHSVMTRCPTAATCWRMVRFGPLNERGVDLPAVRRQHLLNDGQRAEHHTVAHAPLIIYLWNYSYRRTHNRMSGSTRASSSSRETL